jgi:hypothetical protein
MSNSDPLKIAMALTNGGRALNACKYVKNKNLGNHERHILLVIGSELDFNGDFTSPDWWIPISRLVEITGISRAGVFRALAKLEDPEGNIKKGLEADPYIVRVEKEKGRALYYALGTRVFREWQKDLENMLKNEALSKSDNISQFGMNQSPGETTGQTNQSQGETTPSQGETTPSRKVRRGESHSETSTSYMNASRESCRAIFKGDEKLNSASVLSRKEQEEYAKACGEMLYVPANQQNTDPDYPDEKPRFVPIRALHRCMLVALEKISIEEMQLALKWAEHCGYLGRFLFNPNKIRQDIRALIDEARDNNFKIANLELSEEKAGTEL